MKTILSMFLLSVTVCMAGCFADDPDPDPAPAPVPGIGKAVCRDICRSNPSYCNQCNKDAEELEQDGVEGSGRG